MSVPPKVLPARGRIPTVREVDGRAERISRLPDPPDQTIPGFPAPAKAGSAPEPALLEPLDSDTGVQSFNAVTDALAEKMRELESVKLKLRVAQQAAALAARPTVKVESDSEEDSVVAKMIGRAVIKRVKLVAVLALLTGAPGIYSAVKGASDPKPAKVELVNDARSDITTIASAQSAMAAQRKTDIETDAKRWRIAMAMLCSQGLRADGLGNIDCATILEKAEFAAQPLDRKSPPVWKTRLEWPAIPAPPPK